MNETPVQFDEAAALRVNWFDGDFGDIGDRALSDKVVTSRGGARCGYCHRTVAKGERCRVTVMKWKDGNEVRTYRYCSLCCAASILDDDGMIVSERIDLYDENPEVQP